MKLATLYFNRDDKNFDVLVNVWKKSAYVQMPHVKQDVVKLDYKIENRHVAMAKAHIAMCDYILKQTDPVVMCDSDLLFIGDVTKGLDEVRHLGFTIRKTKRQFSSGVWFYHPTPIAKKMIQFWKDETELMLKNTDDIMLARKEYGGIDQLSQARTYERFSEHIDLLPCCIYNAEKTCWKNMNKDCTVVHIYSDLRAIVQNGKPITKETRHLQRWVDLWRSYANEVCHKPL